MSIVLGAITTGTSLHGSVKPSAWEYTRAVQTFFAVTGELHLQGRLHGRDLMAWYFPSGYATHTLLQTHIDNLNALVGTSGTMVWTSGADIHNFTNCVFNGFEPDEDPWQDGSGVNGWLCHGVLKFRQIKT